MPGTIANESRAALEVASAWRVDSDNDLKKEGERARTTDASPPTGGTYQAAR